MVDDILSLKKVVSFSGLANNDDAAEFAKKIKIFRGDWVNEYIKSYEYYEVDDVLKMYAGGGTHSMSITIEDFSKALAQSPDGGHTLVNAYISVSYDCGIMTLDSCTLETE